MGNARFAEMLEFKASDEALDALQVSYLCKGNWP